MATQDFEALARRCEQATGPDRELDGLIEVALDPMRETILYNEPGPFPQKAVRGPIKDLVLTGRDLADYISAPSYTASLDAALTLVPEGCNWCIDTREGPPAANVGGMWVEGRTPALALCAASLRARA